MEDEAFDGINLEDLSGSESPILDGDNFGRIESVTQNQKPTETQAQDKPAVDPNAVDMDALANLEVIDIVPAGTEDASQEGSKTETKSSQTPASNPKGSSPSSQDAFTSFATVLKDAGVLSSLNEEDLGEIKSTDDLVKAIEKQIKSNEYAKLNDDQKKWLEALETGVPEQEVKTSQTNAAQYKRITDDQIEESEPLQFELIKRSFLIKGFDVSTAEKYASLAVQTDTAKDDAIQAKLALVAHEESKIQSQVESLKEKRNRELKEEQEALLSLRSKINETSEVLPGMQINATTKDKIYASITSPVKVDNGNPLNEVMDKYQTDPEYKLKLHALHVVTKGFTDFSKITNSVKTQTTKNFESVLKSTGSGTIGSPAGRTAGDSGVAQGMTSKEIAEAIKTINF